MKNKILLLCVLISLSINCLFAQTGENSLRNVTVTISSTNFDISKQHLRSFISKTPEQIISDTESKDNLIFNFYLNDKEFFILDSLLPTLGYIINKEVSTVNNNDEINRINLEIKYLSDKKATYEKETFAMVGKDERYYTYWQEIRTIEYRLFELQRDLKKYDEKFTTKVYITLQNETNDLTSDNISWVNMPGLSYDMLFVENPANNIAPSQFQGFMLKYMFTRGKSYGIAGAMKKSSTEVADSMLYTELFLFGFGQDFYTRHFGRGKRQFLNLYTGYNIGGMFATADKRSKMIAYGKLFLGVELFKNKNFLIDNNVGYFIPFSYNRNLRGITYSASFNFVF